MHIGSHEKVRKLAVIASFLVALIAGLGWGGYWQYKSWHVKFRIDTMSRSSLLDAVGLAIADAHGSGSNLPSDDQVWRFLEGDGAVGRYLPMILCGQFGDPIFYHRLSTNSFIVAVRVRHGMVGKVYDSSKQPIWSNTGWEGTNGVKSVE
jgi:hypothetical protein